MEDRVRFKRVLGCLVCVIMLAVIADSAGAFDAIDSEMFLNPSHPEHPAWKTISRTGLTESDWVDSTGRNTQRMQREMGNRDLPERVDNSEQPYFRGIFSQVNGSCSQASGVGYIFTYEIDWARDVPADIDANRYPSHFTYNFLNNGLDWASDPFDGWNIVQECGVPAIEVYGGMAAGGFKRWLTGYDNYYHAMQNRIRTTSFIQMDTEDDLVLIKQWFDNHAQDDPVGGLVLFGANTIGLESDVLPVDTPEEGKFVIRQWGPLGQFLADHLMTFVGYDDRICLDYNGDGLYTNDMDTNGDGHVDMSDWEVGALIIANSWGTGWANDGFCYMPYRLLVLPADQHGISIYNQGYTIDTLAEYAPLITMKVTMTHSCRNKIKVTTGISPEPDADEPETRLQLPIFNFQGGPNYMQGGTDEEDKVIEFGLDVSRLLAEIQSGQAATFFLEVTENDPEHTDEGSIESFSLMDYTSGSPVEITGTGCPISLTDNGVTRTSVTASVTFDSPVIDTTFLPGATHGQSYSQTMSASGGSPPYSWRLDLRYEESIGSRDFPSITGVRLTPSPNDDDGYVRADLDFEFPFFSDKFNHVTITTDGSIVFEDGFAVIRGSNHLSNTAAITPMGSDLQQFTDQGGGIFFESRENCAVIRWITGLYNQPEIHLDFAVVLHDSGVIDFVYGNNLSTGFSFVSGISDGQGNVSFASIMSGSDIPDNYNLVWEMPDYALDPADGMHFTDTGVFHGVPEETGTGWQLPLHISDINGLSDKRIISFMSSSGQPFYNLMLRDSNLAPLDLFRLKRILGNPLNVPLNVDEYIILDIADNYWFWPSWSNEAGYQSWSLDSDRCAYETILTFTWPEISGSAPGLRFWGAALEQGTSNLIDYDLVNWSYGD
jgi:hypothetical protein